MRGNADRGGDPGKGGPRGVGEGVNRDREERGCEWSHLEKGPLRRKFRMVVGETEGRQTKVEETVSPQKKRPVLPRSPGCLSALTPLSSLPHQQNFTPTKLRPPAQSYACPSCLVIPQDLRHPSSPSDSQHSQPGPEGDFGPEVSRQPPGSGSHPLTSEVLLPWVAMETTDAQKRGEASGEAPLPTWSIGETPAPAGFTRDARPLPSPMRLVSPSSAGGGGGGGLHPSHPQRSLLCLPKLGALADKTGVVEGVLTGRQWDQAWEGLRAAQTARPSNPTLDLNIPGWRPEALPSAFPQVLGVQSPPSVGPTLYRG